MRTIKNNLGFTAVELILVAVIVVLIGAVGYKIYNTNRSIDKTTKNTEAVLDQAPIASSSVPAKINSTSDLDQAQRALANYDSTDADDEDLSQLDSELSAF